MSQVKKINPHLHIYMHDRVVKSGMVIIYPKYKICILSTSIPWHIKKSTCYPISVCSFTELLKFWGKPWQRINSSEWIYHFGTPTAYQTLPKTQMIPGQRSVSRHEGKTWNKCTYKVLHMVILHSLYYTHNFYRNDFTCWLQKLGQSLKRWGWKTGYRGSGSRVKYWRFEARILCYLLREIRNKDKSNVTRWLNILILHKAEK